MVKISRKKRLNCLKEKLKSILHLNVLPVVSWEGRGDACDSKKQLIIVLKAGLDLRTVMKMKKRGNLTYQILIISFLIFPLTRFSVGKCMFTRRNL